MVRNRIPSNWQRSSSSLKTLVFSFSSALFKLFHPSPEEQRCDEDDDLTCDFESGGRLKIKEDNIWKKYLFIVDVFKLHGHFWDKKVVCVFFSFLCISLHPLFYDMHTDTPLIGKHSSIPKSSPESRQTGQKTHLVVVYLIHFPSCFYLSLLLLYWDLLSVYIDCVALSLPHRSLAAPFSSHIQSIRDSSVLGFLADARIDSCKHFRWKSTVTKKKVKICSHALIQQLHLGPNVSRLKCCCFLKMFYLFVWTNPVSPYAVCAGVP